VRGEGEVKTCFFKGQADAANTVCYEEQWEILAKGALASLSGAPPRSVPIVLNVAGLFVGCL
jgi:hypothetical protein